MLMKYRFNHTMKGSFKCIVLCKLLRQPDARTSRLNVYKQHLSDNLLIIIIMLSDLNIIPDSQIDYKFVL